MKKFNLTVPKPCHENWNQMTPEAKGRFCGSCQKIVVDFTGMSDRELADFFKKPTGSVCGRFQKDQLNREITVPKKPIPWLRHFIHIAWPAFILLLKSCNIKDRLTGNDSSSLALSDNRSTLKEYDVIMMGLPLALEQEEAIPPPPVGGQVEIGKGEVAGFVLIEPDTLMGDIEITPVNTAASVEEVQAIETIDTAFVEMDTVTVANSFVQCSRSYTISCGVTGKIIRTYEDTKEAAVEQAPALTAYPNPVRAGGMLNIKLATSKSPFVSIQLLTASGQRLRHKPLGKWDHESVVSLPLPAGLSAGVYFLQAVDATGATIQSRILINQ